jgi:hypothetical protein
MSTNRRKQQVRQRSARERAARQARRERAAESFAQGRTQAEVADQARHGIQRVCDSDSLVLGFLAHTGLSLADQPSP